MKYKFPQKSILSGDFNSLPQTSDIKRLKSKWNDINERETCPGWDIIDYNFSDLVPLETRVYETFASDHHILETKYYL
jgi:endonuclease/exonuclease/phosphatase (EEP) superfamily protein YafD